MIQVLRESNPVARKNYSCAACTFILNEGFNGFSITELREIVKARRQGYKILKWQKYIASLILMVTIHGHSEPLRKYTTFAWNMIYMRTNPVERVTRWREERDHGRVLDVW